MITKVSNAETLDAFVSYKNVLIRLIVNIVLRLLSFIIITIFLICATS